MYTIALKLKIKLRQLICEAYWASNRWVVPQEVCDLVDAGKYKEAHRAVEELREVWGLDPELTYVGSAISFLECDLFPDEFVEEGERHVW